MARFINPRLQPPRMEHRYPPSMSQLQDGETCAHTSPSRFFALQDPTECE